VLNTFFKTMLKHGMPHFENMDAGRGPPIVSRTLMRAFGARDGLAWEHLELIRKRWKGKLVVKGIISPEDARMCRDAGADGIMVSNHGGRQLDGTISGLRSLAEIARDAGGMTVMYDGGVRRGSDVLKALALGASFVFVGRPMLCAAAVAGEEGVKHAIGLLSEEIDRNMAMMGIQNPSQMCYWHELPDLALKRIAWIDRHARERGRSWRHMTTSSSAPVQPARWWPIAFPPIRATRCCCWKRALPAIAGPAFPSAMRA